VGRKRPSTDRNHEIGHPDVVKAHAVSRGGGGGGGGGVGLGLWKRRGFRPWEEGRGETALCEGRACQMGLPT